MIEYSLYILVEQSQCPNGWERFGGSYYCFPNTKSTPNLASQTCSRYSNNSQLMKIRHLSEIYYAAYSLKIHNQPELILQIDPKLLKRKIDCITYIFNCCLFLNRDKEFRCIVDEGLD